MSTRPSPEEQELIGRKEAMFLTSWLCELHEINEAVATEVARFDHVDKPSVGRTCWLADAKAAHVVHQATRQTGAVVGTTNRQRMAELVVERLVSPDLQLLARIQSDPEAEAQRYVLPGDYGHDAFTEAIRTAAFEAGDTLRELMPPMAEALLEPTAESYENLITRGNKALGILWRVKTTPALKESDRATASEHTGAAENNPAK